MQIPPLAARPDELACPLDRLLRPRSIALIGASETRGSLGQSVLSNLGQAGFSGELHLVNPRRPVIQGQQCLASIEELRAGIDCAVLAIPGGAVLAAAQSCAEKQVGSLIVFSAGFAESDEQGRSAQQALARIAQQNDMILLGPNCLGMVNSLDGIPLTFVATPPQEPAGQPGAAILSQSGALAAVIAVNMRHHKIPLTYSISTGNEASCGIEEFVEHLIGNAATRVMALVVEQFRKPQRFLALARRARENGQYLVLLHPGRSGAAQASAATHTGAIVGDYDAMHTLVTRAGVLHVETLEELVDVTQILTRCADRPQGGTAIFAESGAFKALALDHCEKAGLALPAFSPETEEALREALPAFTPPSNPLDLTAQGLVDPSLYGRTLAPILKDKLLGSVLLAIILTDTMTRDLKLPRIVDAIRILRPRKSIVFTALDEGAPFDCEAVTELRALGVACFPSPERAIRALAHAAAFSCAYTELSGNHRNAIPIHFESKGILAEYRSKEIFSQLGIRVPAGRLAKTPQDGLRVAREIGFPIALKAQAADLPHKTDAGGVILGITSEAALLEGWTQIQQCVQSSRPELLLDGLLVEKMGEEGAELIVGARRDSQWGPVLLIGYGGTGAEAMNDTRLLAPDLSLSEIKDELLKLRCARLLSGFRDSPPADLDAASEVIARIAGLMHATPQIREIDINPLLVGARGEGAIALDALIVAEDA